MKAPGFQGGQKTPALTEFIDIYPTLCDLAGLPKPSHLQGESLVPLMRDPTLPGKAAAISRFRNGDTIRTDDFRYTEYTGKQGKLQAKMLYNHRTDTGEDTNIAGTPEVIAEVKQLSKQLREGMGK